MQPDLPKLEQELVKHRLSCLPDIKQEIRYYLELSPANNHFSKLKKILSQLEEFPDIQELLKSDENKKLLLFFGKLEIAKSVAITEILTIRTNLELGLDNWHVGLHVIRNSSGFELNRFKVDHLWAVNIIPSFQVPARIAVLYQSGHYRIAFGIGASLDNVSSSVIQVELPENWRDPLESILRKFDLFHGKQQLSLDGIGYEFSNRSWTSQTDIHFSNPRDTQFAELEKAFFSVAKTIVDEKGQQAEKDYLVIWRKYMAQ